MKKTKIQAITGPISVVYTCPNCLEEIDVPYNRFPLMNEYSGDWCYRMIQCEECGEEFEIDGVEWD